MNRADAYIGRLLTILEDRGLLDETLVLYVGDHGIAFPRAKCTLYDPGIEISLIARLPGSALSGGVAPGGMVSNLDVVPTLIDLTGGRSAARPARMSRRPRCCRWPPVRPPATPNSSSRRPITATTTPCAAFAPSAGSTSATFETGLGLVLKRFPATSPAAAPTVTWRAAWTPRTTWKSSSMTFRPIPMSKSVGGRPPDQSKPRRSKPNSETSKVIKWMRDTGDPLLDGPIPPCSRRSTAARR